MLLFELLALPNLRNSDGRGVVRRRVSVVANAVEVHLGGAAAAALVPRGWLLRRALEIQRKETPGNHLPSPALLHSPREWRSDGAAVDSCRCQGAASRATPALLPSRVAGCALWCRILHSDLTHDASVPKSWARARNCRTGFRSC